MLVFNGVLAGIVTYSKIKRDLMKDPLISIGLEIKCNTIRQGKGAVPTDTDTALQVKFKIVFLSHV